MIALSSFRPFNGEDEYAINQIRAHQSWQHAFSNIVYFNAPERELSSSSTTFIESEQFPRIYEFAELAAYQKDWVAIINADIVIGPRFHEALSALNTKRAYCTTSWRYEFEADEPTQHARIVDCGIDFFAASPVVWQHIAATVPMELRIGCQQWDSWILGAFSHFAARSFFGVSRFKCIYHPKHGNRKYGYDVGKIDYLCHSAWPPEL